MNKPGYKHLYGPVPSRRLGRSLGIDLVPFKTCTYDCIYCQLGRTTEKTLVRREYVPVDVVLDELGRKLADGDAPDFISLAGSGEPTLHGGLGRLISGIKSKTKIPVAVITNGSLLWDRGAAEPLMTADLVIPSLDAGDAAMFERINRPHPGIDFDRMVQGLADFRNNYRGRLWLEVMLLDGLNDSRAEVRKIADLAGRIRPDRVQLNTAVRPPAEVAVRPIPFYRMQELARLFYGTTEVIASGSGRQAEEATEGGNQGEKILPMLKRRPCTVEDVSRGLGIHRLSALKELEALVKKGKARKVETGGSWFYIPEDGMRNGI
jgi:wyosine [tRNA(Phe)-imidazoG37] synthetase (radical SAM superfamily)